MTALNHTTPETEPNEIDVLLTNEEACQYLHISPRKFAYLMADGELTFTKIGHLVRIRRSDLRTYVEFNSHRKVPKWPA